jgi:hypothetical protein
LPFDPKLVHANKRVYNVATGVLAGLQKHVTSVCIWNVLELLSVCITAPSYQAVARVMMINTTATRKEISMIVGSVEETTNETSS